MSDVANRRAFIEAAQAVVKASEIDPAMLSAVFGSLAQVVTDVTGQECELVLRFKLGTEAATHATEGGSNE